MGPDRSPNFGSRTRCPSCPRWSWIPEFAKVLRNHFFLIFFSFGSAYQMSSKKLTLRTVFFDHRNQGLKQVLERENWGTWRTCFDYYYNSALDLTVWPVVAEEGPELESQLVDSIRSEHCRQILVASSWRQMESHPELTDVFDDLEQKRSREDQVIPITAVDQVV